MQNKKNISKIIKDTIYYGIILFLVAIISVSLFIPNGLVKVFGVGWYRVVSDSMEPLILVDDFIIVTKDTDVDNFEDGDIIVFETHFRNNQGIYMHGAMTHHFYKVDEHGHILTYPHSQAHLEPHERVIDKWYKPFGEDYFVTEDDIIGRHTTTLKTSYVISFITSPYGVGVILINIGLVIGIIILFQYDKHKKIEKKHKEGDENDVADMDE